MRNLWLKIKQVFKSKFFIYTVIAPAFGYLVFVMLISIIENVEQYGTPFKFSLYQSWGVTWWQIGQEYLLFLLISPVMGLMFFPVSCLTYIISTLLDKDFSNKRHTLVATIIIAGILYYFYAVLIRSGNTPTNVFFDKYVITFSIVGIVTTILAEYLNKKKNKIK